MTRPRLLDLFCGAGGAAMGYHRAGFDVVGVDIRPQPRYPFTFHQADAMTFPLGGFDAIHASPPCQRWSHVTRPAGRASHPDLIGPTRARLAGAGVPFVIENVPGAPLVDPVQLCGSQFDLDIQRHRLFESGGWRLSDHHWPCRHLIWAPRYKGNHRRRMARVMTVTGHGTSGYGGRADDWRRAMGITWATKRELAQAIPPAYTEFIGAQLIAALS